MYKGPFIVKALGDQEETVTIKAIGIKSGYSNSAVATKVIKFKAAEKPTDPGVDKEALATKIAEVAELDEEGIRTEIEEQAGFPFSHIKAAAESIDGHKSEFIVSGLEAGEGYTLLIEMVEWDRTEGAGAVLGSETTGFDVKEEESVKNFSVTKDFDSNMVFDTKNLSEFKGKITLSSNYNLQGTIAEISLKKGDGEVNFGDLFKSLKMKTGNDETAQDYVVYYPNASSFNYGLYPNGTYAGDEFVAGISQDTTIEAEISDEAEVGIYTFTAVFKEITTDGTTTVLETPLDTLVITIEVK